jgi:peptide/nickel transport system ATP-binding protein
MRKGEIVEQGFAKDILQTPKHPYTKALLACRPAGKTKGVRLPVVSDFINPEPEVTENPITSKQQKTQNPESQTQNTVLEIKNLSVHFPVKKNLFGKATQYFKAVDDVSFTVLQGDIVGLVGESGCGKTTLGRSILQLIKPTAGKILLDGKDLAQTNVEVLRKMRKELQIVFQDPYGSLNPRITIGEAILEPLKVHSVFQNNKQRKEKVMELLEKVNLDISHFNRYPHQFSGGQRQRICIARALALNPSFLIFDESVSALDVSVQAQVLNLLNDLKAEFGFTAIFISHDLSVVHYICNRILVMYKGKIVEEGTADQVYNHPANEYTKKLVSAIPGKIMH